MAEGGDGRAAAISLVPKHNFHISNVLLCYKSYVIFNISLKVWYIASDGEHRIDLNIHAGMCETDYGLCFTWLQTIIYKSTYHQEYPVEYYSLIFFKHSFLKTSLQREE